MTKKNVMVLVLMSLVAVYIVAPVLTPCTSLIQAYLKVTWIDPIEAADVEYSIYIVNRSPWPVMFKEMNIHQLINLKEKGEFTMFSWQPEITLLPFLPSEYKGGRAKLGSKGYWSGNRYISFWESIDVLDVTLTGYVRIGLAPWSPISLEMRWTRK